MTTTRQPSGPRAVSRRAILFSGGGVAAGAAAASAGWAASSSPAAATAAGTSAPGGIAPDDDLMREHGVLKRVLLCYREMIARGQSGGQLTAAHIHDCALIIHDYIEGFHEGLEEGYVFPRLVKAGQLTSTVTTLLTQHARGRVITQYLLAHTAGRQLNDPGPLIAAMAAFDRMYEPHEAREDTVVFPAFRQIVPPAELADLGQQFADLEHQQFGTGEFTVMVNRVAAIEQDLGIYDLNQFTPQVSQYTAAG
jgi:hemerythrin-like domain-containing protein